jgi:tRNA(fMet)-specific endonuclease VapC
VVIFELAFGLMRTGRAAALGGFERLVASIQTLDLDAEAADHAARIRVELEAADTPIGLADLLIAATARRHGCTLVTHNTNEFSRVSGLALDDWY